MSRLELAGGAGIAEPFAVVGNYDAARDLGDRTYIYYPFLDNRQALGGWTLRRLWEKSEWAYDNIGFVGGTIDTAARMCAGLRPRSLSGDKDWDREADEVFARATENPEVWDLAGELDGEGLQEAIFACKFRLGDGAVVLSSSAGGAPRVALREGKTIGETTRTAAESMARRTPEWRDGIRRDRAGKAVQFRFVSGAGEVETLGREAVVYFSNTRKRGLWRGVPYTHRLINHVHDEADILRFMKAGVKSRNALIFAIRDYQGGGDVPSIGTELSERVSRRDGDGRVTGIVKEEGVTGPTIPKMGEGQSLDFLKDDRPGPNQLELLDYVKRDMTMGFGGVPVEVLWKLEKLSTANTETVLAMCMGFVVRESKWYVRQVGRRMRNWVIAKEMKRGALGEPSTGIWWRHGWIPSARMTANFGKFARALLELTNRGEMPADDLHAWLYGTDRREDDRKHVETLRERMELCEAMDVPFERAFPMGSGVVSDLEALREALEEEGAGAERSAEG